MLEFVDATEPDTPTLRDWLKSNTTAESESTIEKYVGFQRSINLLELQEVQYRTTPRGAAFAETGDPELVFEALLENVAGFETILQTLDNQQTTAAEIQASLQEAYPEYQFPQAVVGRHLEWLQAIGVVEKQQSTDGYELTSFGQQLLQEKLETKFRSDYEYVTRVFDDADNYVLQLWAPYVTEGFLTDGLEVLSNEFETEYGTPIELVINDSYTEHINELRAVAAEETKAYGEPAFRFLQILEQLR